MSGPLDSGFLLAKEKEGIPARQHSLMFPLPLHTHTPSPPPPPPLSCVSRRVRDTLELLLLSFFSLAGLLLACLWRERHVAHAWSVPPFLLPFDASPPLFSRVAGSLLSSFCSVSLFLSNLDGAQLSSSSFLPFLSPFACSPHVFT